MESAGTSGNVYQSPRSKCFLFMCTNHLDPSVFAFKCFKCFHNVYQCHVDSKSFSYLFLFYCFNVKSVVYANTDVVGDFTFSRSLAFHVIKV